MARPLSRLARHARAHRRTAWLAATCSVLNKVFDLFPPVLIAGAVDTFVRREESWLGRHGVADPIHQLWLLCAVNALVWVLESLFQYLAARLWRELAQTVEHELRLVAYEHVQKIELSWHEDRSTGGLLAILNDDVNQLERFLDVGADKLIRTAATVILIGAMFAYTHPELAVLAFLPIPLIVWGSLRYQRLLEPRYVHVRARAGDIASLVAGNLGGMATIRSFVAEEREVARVEERSEAYRQANRSAIRVSAAFDPLIRMAILAGFSLLLVRGGYLVHAGALEVSALAGMLFLVQRLLWPLTMLGEVLDLYQRAMASTARVLDLVDVPPAPDGARALDHGAVRGEVRFEGVTFGYDGDRPALEDLDLVARAGETTAVVGPTGAGKSTLVKLLLRFHSPQQGRVLLDGDDISALRASDLRGAIAYVGQDVFLFDGTVGENVSYGSFGAEEADLRAAARTAEADGFVREMRDGYDTLVGERGQKLSGGQRQRLSLARALLKDAPVLVLDEATSAVDNETEAAIQRSLARIAHGRTVIAIAHRLSTVRHADRICVLDRGRLVEEGTHEQLLAREGLYSSLWAVQTGEAAAAVGGSG